jgi:carbamoyltransferase
MPMPRYYVGLAATFHDPALAVVDERGEVLFAEASERFLQVKRAYGAAADPREVVRRVLRDHCDPQGEFILAKAWSAPFTRLMEFQSLLGLADHERLPRRAGGLTRYLCDRSVLFYSLWLQHTSLRLSGGHFADILLRDHGNRRVRFVKFPHHLAHAANACYTSPFTEAACAVVDGQGEAGAMSFYAYRGGELRRVAAARGPESIGILYSVCTDLAGFSSEGGEEWKLMGLAPYGEPDPAVLEELRAIVRVDGLRLRYPRTPVLRAAFARLQRRARPPGAPAMAWAGFAATVQAFYAETMSRLLGNFHALGLGDALVLGGGCGLNSSYNGRLLAETPFRQLHVPSAPGDDGNALGCALLAWRQDHPGRPAPARVLPPYLGSAIAPRALEHLVRFSRLPGLRHLPGTVHEAAAELLAAGKLLGWVQGRAEFGPRALGNRSILADPRPAEMKDRINALVKFREEFRPFAPSILDEHGPEWFEDYQVSPYMERTLRFTAAARARVPAIVHVNATGRLQSVRREWNERYHDLIAAFHRRTGVPMLLNTSFNIMGKPIIHSLEDALGVFHTTGLDALVVGDYLIEKPPASGAP